MRSKRIFAAIAASVIALSAAGTLAACHGPSQLTEEKLKQYVPAHIQSDMKLDWYDEFEGTDYDRTKWHQGFEPAEGKEQTAPRKGGYWTYDAISVRDGNLVITTDWREDGEYGAGWYTGSLETSKYTYNSSEQSAGSYERTYGYFEVRCKVPAFFGGWAAFWLMPSDNFAGDKRSEKSPGDPDYLAPADNDCLNTGTDGAEIDIFESPFYYDEGSRYTVNHAVHFDGYNEFLKSSPKTGIKVKNLYDDYHTYGLEWTENHYKFYVDGRCTHTVTADYYRNREGKRVKQNIISQVDEYIILSFEVVSPDGAGGTNGWCGDPSDNDKNRSYEYAIDYIAVFA